MFIFNIPTIPVLQFALIIQNMINFYYYIHHFSPTGSFVQYKSDTKTNVKILLKQPMKYVVTDKSQLVSILDLQFKEAVKYPITDKSQLESILKLQFKDAV